MQGSARSELPDLRYHRTQLRHGVVDSWRATVRIGHYAPRFVSVEFSRRSPNTPHVFADGPTDSPHRYSDRGRTRLCLWYPEDPPDRKWTVDDGLLALFGLAAHHLFKEAWWREHDEWLGEEAPHGELTSDEPHMRTKSGSP